MKKGMLSKTGEWAGAVGDKLGRFLPSKKNKETVLPRKNSAPNLVNYGAEEDDSDVRIGWDASDTENSGRGSSPDASGPDTSSLSAFLMSLLSTDKRDHHNGESTTLGFGRLGFGRSGEQTPPPQQYVPSEEVHTQSGEFYDVDWLLVDEHVKVTPAVKIPKRQLSSISADRLPRMSDDSSLLTDDIRCSIHPALPTLAKGRRWVLLYSTEKHGMSLLTLYRNSNLMPGPRLLVAGDREGAVFGGLITAPLEPSPKRKYLGTSDSFVFSNVTGHDMIFHPTGLNRYYILAMPEALALGGGVTLHSIWMRNCCMGQVGLVRPTAAPVLLIRKSLFLSMWSFGDSTTRNGAHRSRTRHLCCRGNRDSLLVEFIHENMGCEPAGRTTAFA